MSPLSAAYRTLLRAAFLKYRDAVRLLAVSQDEDSQTHHHEACVWLAWWRLTECGRFLEQASDVRAAKRLLARVEQHDAATGWRSCCNHNTQHPHSKGCDLERLR